MLVRQRRFQTLQSTNDRRGQKFLNARQDRVAEEAAFH